MKYLTSAESQHELLELKALLTDRGIPSMLQTELAPYSKAMLFVLIDEQYDDANKLMSDPAYEVSKPIDPAVLKQLEAQATASDGVLWASIGKYALTATVLAVLAAAYLIDRFS
ncbi:MAG: hypothetical protein P8Y12_00770 [Gammaproteobacteria bacterium]|jgi:hypothetical protein